MIRAVQVVMLDHVNPRPSLCSFWAWESTYSLFHSISMFLCLVWFGSQIHFSGSINLKSLQAEQSRNFVSPTSRSSNSIAFRFCNSPSATNVSRVNGTHACVESCNISWPIDFSQEIQIRPPASSCRYMVVFQYGSAVLFNVEDHEVEHYMQILRRHASGLLPEMRKDG